MKKQTIAIVASTLLLASGVSFGQAASNSSNGSSPIYNNESNGISVVPSAASGTPNGGNVQPAGGLTKGKIAVIGAAAAGGAAALSQSGSGGGNTGTTGTTGTN